jgi:hypothetical protein
LNPLLFEKTCPFIYLLMLQILNPVASQSKEQVIPEDVLTSRVITRTLRTLSTIKSHRGYSAGIKIYHLAQRRYRI